MSKSKSSVSRLPFPMLSKHPEQCVACAYDLAGVQNRCPECGVRIDGEPGALLIAGVPRLENTNPWRRLAFVVLAIAVFAFSQGLFILGQFFGFLAMAFIFGVIVVSIIALVVTSPTKKHSVERIAFTRAGFGRAAWRGEYDTRFVPWTGREEIRPKRVGTVWQQLTIRAPNDMNKPKRVLEAGFRCRREELDWVCSAIEAFSTDRPVPDHPDDQAGARDAETVCDAPDQW